MKNCNDERAFGELVKNWSPPPPPPREEIAGAYCTLTPLIPEHAADLHAANQHDRDNKNWAYLPYGPFDTLESYREWITEFCLGDDPLFFSVIDHRSEKPAGIASFLRITPQAGSIEVGHIHYSPLMQRATLATEAMFLMMRRAFELGYRRYEWKCNALNQASCAAALRLGFSYEGVFRQMMVVKGRNRDTAWYSIIDKEWPALQRAFLIWLDEKNFGADGSQRKSLSEVIRESE